MTMSKYFIAFILLIAGTATAQPKGSFFYKPYPIFKAHNATIIAGSVNTFTYTDYYGKNVQTDAAVHSSAERLVLELFNDMKKGDVDAVSSLYDTSFQRKEFDGSRMMDKLKKYNEIRFRSKFRTGSLIIIRYDFISTDSKDIYPYFAVVQNAGDNYFLTTNINITDPFTVAGSFSPYNLYEKAAEQVNINKMTPFYFVNKDGKVFYTNDLPGEDYTAVYLLFDFYNNTHVFPQTAFIKQLQKTAQNNDTVKLKSMLVKEDAGRLDDSYFGNYYYDEILKIFKYYPTITPLASIKTNEGLVLYFSYASEQMPAQVASLILKQSGNNWSLSLHLSDDAINNVLQNIYIRQAINDYFKKKV